MRCPHTESPPSARYRRLIKAHLEEALQHIGPPCDLDIPQLCESLTRDDEETRILTAKYLALLGLNGRSASVALEAAADKSIQDYSRRKRSSDLAFTRPVRRFRKLRPVDFRGRRVAAAVWEVTHDMPRFLKLIERLAIAADEPIMCSRSTRLLEISADDCRLIERMLRHPNPIVQETALDVLSGAGPRAEPLKDVLLQMAMGRNTDLSQKAVATLTAIGAVVGPDVTPVLISKFRGGTISLQQLADGVGRLGIRSNATQAILEGGLHDRDQGTAVSCMSVLCITSSEPRRTARMIIDATRDREAGNRLAISALNDLKLADDVVIPFLVAQLQNSDYWTRHDAINSIGSCGAKASKAVTPLKKLLDDESPLIRLKAAKAIFQVTNNPADLENQLDIVFATLDLTDHYKAIETIGELNRLGREVRALCLG